MSRRALLVVAALAAGAVAVAGLLVWFAPWRLFTDVEVHEALPVAGAPVDPGPTPSPPPTSAPDPPLSTAAPSRTTIATGELVSHEHETHGTVQVFELGDGSRVLRLEGLDTSDGPDLHVWLTDAPVIEGEDGWHVFDDGVHVDLGPLKGNKGDQNYPVPAEVDLTVLHSVSVWCVRFSVSFGAAELLPA